MSTARGQSRDMFYVVVIETDNSEAASIALVVSTAFSIYNIIRLLYLISDIFP